MNSGIFLILMWYFDNLIEQKQPFYFPFKISYWKTNKKKILKEENLEINSQEELNEKEEQNRIFKNEIEQKVKAGKGVQILNLNKIYSKFSCAKKTLVHALKNLSLFIEHDSVFCLLGHNGAGSKIIYFFYFYFIFFIYLFFLFFFLESTTLNILTGVERGK